jgi:mono/diheme cytochrome c family protein
MHARLLPLLLALAACGSGAHPSPVVPPEARIEASKVYATRCASCHGPRGQGDGPASASLSPRPRPLGDRGWLSGVSDQHLQTVIQRGGRAVGRSPSMPAHPDLEARPQVVQALVEKLRAFGG